MSVSTSSVRHSAPVRFGNISPAGYLNTCRLAKRCSRAVLVLLQALEARDCTLNTATCVVFWDTDNLTARKRDDIELTCRKLQVLFSSSLFPNLDSRLWRAADPQCTSVIYQTGACPDAVQPTQAHTAGAVTKIRGESIAAPDVCVVAYSNKQTSSSSRDHIAVLKEMPDVLVRPVSSWRCQLLTHSPYVHTKFIAST